MASNTIQTLDGLYKRVYGEKPEKVVPDFARVQKEIPFSSRKKLGDRFEVPVVLQMEHGVTYANPATDGAFTLSAAVAGATKPAYVSPYEMCLRSAIAYSAAFQAQGNNEASFQNATGLMVESMVETLRKRLEIGMLGYGRVGFRGDIAASIFTFRAADNAPGVWMGMEGAYVEFFDAITGTDTLRLNAGGVTGERYITKVDLSGTLVAITLNDPANIVNGDYCFLRTQRTATAWKDMVGLTQIANDATVFGITVANYSGWQALRYDCGATDLSVDSIQKAAGKLAIKGADGKLLCLISPRTWAIVCNDLAALVHYNDNAKARYELGAESIVVRSPYGPISIEPHAMVKEGHGLILQPKRFERFGATDVTFKRPAPEGVKLPESFFTELADSAGFEIRAYSNQCMFTGKPGSVCELYSIVNS